MLEITHSRVGIGISVTRNESLTEEVEITIFGQEPPAVAIVTALLGPSRN